MRTAPQRSAHVQALWWLVAAALLATLFAVLNGCTHSMDSGFTTKTSPTQAAGLQTPHPIQRSTAFTPPTPFSLNDNTAQAQPGEELWVIARPQQSVSASSIPLGLFQLATGGESTPIEQRLSPMPLLASDITARIDGLIASVQYTQTYTNPNTTKIETVYVFPLPSDSAVTDFVMTLGDRRIRGVVRPREEAQKLYEQARAQGFQASLLTQHSADIFTQRIANIEPGQPIAVTLTYFQTLTPDAGTYTFTLPLTAPHRYDPTGQATQPKAYAPASPGFRLALDLRPGIDIRTLESPTHAAQIAALSASHQRITFEHPIKSMLMPGVTARDAAPTGRDFVVRYTLADDRPAAHALSHTDPRTGRSYFAVMLYPPNASAAPAPRAPIDLVLLLDASGSMRGRPLEQLQHAALAAIDQLEPSDTVQIVAFGERAETLADAPLAATLVTRQQARAFITRLNSMGGTQLLPALELALEQTRRADTPRIVALLTDALVTTGEPITRALERHADNARVFAFGIGESPNHALLASIAARGRGAVATLSPSDDADAARVMMTRFFERIGGPVFTGLSLLSDQSAAVTTYPAELPDLYAGQPLLITAAVPPGLAPPKRLTLQGLRAGQPFTLNAPLQAAHDAPALVKVVARQQLAQLQAQLRTPLSQADRIATLQSLLTLSQESQVVTPYTSFIAIDATQRHSSGTIGTTIDVPATE